MIPIRDTVRARNFPLVNTVLIILNVVIFWFEVSMGSPALEQFIFSYGLVPVRFWDTTGLFEWLPLLTSMFLHGGWIHLISNMLALYIFGDNVEDRMGHGRYLLFYLLGGLVAGLAHAWAYPGSTLPTVGASGAIAAVLGAYLVLFPQSRVITLVPFPFLFFFPLLEIPAVFYLVFWFVSQLFNGVLALTNETVQEGGVAFWGHIGGFVTGVVLVWLFASRRPRGVHRDYYRDEYFPW